MSAVTASALGAGKIQNMADLAEAVPDLSVGNQFGVNRTFIRGIGLTSIDLGGDGAVAFLQDGAQIARPAGAVRLLRSAARRGVAVPRAHCTAAARPRA